MVLLTALVACGFLLFLSAFMEIPFFSSSSSAEAQHKPASLASTSSHTQQRQKDDTAVDSEHHPEKQHVPAITLVDFDDAVAAFLDRARMENVEKQPVPLLATDDGNDDDPATLPRVAMLYYPTEHAAALALTKALEAALLEDGEAQPTAMEEVLGEEAAGEEDGWIIRVEG